MRKRKKIGLGRKKRNKVLRKLIKLCLILALIFILLSLALDILDTLQNDWDIFVKRHYKQGTTIELLQQELEALKSKNLELDSKLNLTEATIANQNELINDIQETLKNPAWSNEGVAYHYNVVESNKNYEVLEFEEIKEASPIKNVETPDFFSNTWLVPIIVAGGLAIKGIFFRGIPAF